MMVTDIGGTWNNRGTERETPASATPEAIVVGNWRRHVVRDAVHCGSGT
jgi:hypothetical protein